MAGMDDYLNDTSYTGDSSEGGGQHMSLKDQGEGFYGRVTGNQDKKFGDHDPNEDRRKSAAKGLIGGEKNALGGNGSKITGDGPSGARQGEGNVTSDSAMSGFKNSVMGSSSKFGAKGKGQGGFKGKMKKIAPILVAAGGIGGFGIASFFGQMAMPFSLISQLQGNFDSSGVSNYTRTKVLTKFAMHQSTRKSGATDKFIKKHSKIFQKFTGSSEKYFKITKRQRARLLKKGIDVIELGGGEQIMRYHAPNGNDIDIVADKGMAVGGRVAIDDIYENNSDFRDAYYEGTKTWRQSISDWFDNICRKFMTRLGIGRNRFKKFNSDQPTTKTKQDYESTVDGATKDDYNGKIENGKTQNDTKEVPTEDGEGTQTVIDPEHAIPTHVNETDGLGLKRGMKIKEVAEKVEGFASRVGNKLSGLTKFASLINAACVFAEMVGAVTLLVMANEASQILQVSSTIFEGVQKTQVMDSKYSPIHDIANSLTEKKNSIVYTGTWPDATTTTEIYGSAMEGEAVTSIYGNLKTDPNDPSVKSFNLTDAINDGYKGWASKLGVNGADASTYRKCQVSKIVASIFGVLGAALKGVARLAELVACIVGGVTSGGFTCATLIASIIWDLVIAVTTAVAVQYAVSAIVQFLVTKVATMVQRDLAKDIGGVELGNALMSGGNMYMGKNHQGGGGSVASKETLVTYLKQKDEYIADIARHERETLSPFDASSPYTFMGNLLSRSVPILVGSSSVIGGLNNIANVAGKAFSSIMPGARAMSAAVTAQEAADDTAKTCPELDSIGGVGDAFCNPYYVSDMALMEEDPADVVLKVKELNDYNFIVDDSKESDVPEINTDMNNEDSSSRLMEYIVYCGQRDSPWGMTDMNIGNAIKGEQDFIAAVEPIWGGVSDIIQAKAVLMKFGYVSGQSCIAKDGVSQDEVGPKAFTWDEAKYYQRFVEDQRYIESTGLVEKSAVTIALDKYYEEHPLDTSREGILARMTGMTKEKVIATEEALDAFLWMAQYEPDGFFPYGYEEPEEEQERISIDDYSIIELEDYNTIDDNSWKYMTRMEYTIS